MKIAFNPSTVEALITPPNNKDITFDLRGHNIFVRGVKFQGTDTNTWRDIKINNISIGSNTLDLRDSDNTTLTNINGIVTINSTWRPVVDNLTSDSTTSSLSANQGRVLKSLIDDKSDSDHNHDDRYLRLTGGTMNGNARIDHGSGHLYIGNSSNVGWLAVQDICSQDSIGDGIWSIRVDGTASFQRIKFPSNRLIAQVNSGSNSPLKGIKLPYLENNGIGIFSNVGNSFDEGGIVLSEDTCVIYNSFDTGWGLSVRDNDLNHTDISSDDTVAFGIRQDYRAYSRGGFEKKDSSDDYVLLGGGGHKLESALSVNYASSAGNADLLDGYHASYSSSTPWGTIPVITTSGFMDIGKHLEFHFDNTTGSDYSTLLTCTGNYSNIVNLPSESGTLALTSDIPNVTDYYWANIKISNASNSNTTPTFGSVTVNARLSIASSTLTKTYPTSQQLVINGPSLDSSITPGLKDWPGIGFHMPGRTWGSLIFNGNITAINSDYNGYVSYYGAGFRKNGSSDSYVLLGGGGHKLESALSVNYASSSGSTGKLEPLGVYTYDNLSKDIPTNAVSYKIINSGGTDLGDSQYNVLHIPYAYGDWGAYLLFGANNGRFGVKYTHSGVVREVLDSSNYTSYAIPTSASCNKNWSYSGQSGQPSWLWGTNDGTNCYVWNPSNFRVAYASSAENADMVDGYHASSLVKFYLSPMTDSAPADSAKNWFINTMPSASGAIVYNVPGSEKTIIVGKSSGAYGHMLQLNYEDTYLRILRYINGSWQSTDWEKISSGYADSAGSATKLQTPRTIWGQSFNGTANVNGTIYINNSNSSNGAIRLNNDVNSNARISAISDQVIFNTSNAIRFGETAWDWNQWAGLKYTHSNKTIYLGIADGSVFNANSIQSGGTLNLRAGISNIHLNSGTSIVGLPTNGSPYSSSITLRDTSISMGAYGDISMSTGPGVIELKSGYGGVKLSCQGNNASVDSGGFKVEASQGVYLNSGNSGNVYLCQGGGNVSIGYSSPSYKLDVNGQMRASGFHHGSVNSDNYMLLAGGGYKSFGGSYDNPIFLGYLDLNHGNDGTISSSFYCLGYSVPFTYTRGGNYCRIYIPDTSYQVFYIKAAVASVNYSGGGMDTWVGDRRGEGAWWLHCYASSSNEVRVKGFCQRNSNNDSWWGGNPLWSGSSGANRITVCIFGYVTIR